MDINKIDVHNGQCISNKGLQCLRHITYLKIFVNDRITDDGLSSL